MKIAIVGSSGYLASYLKRYFISNGHTVLNIDKQGDDVTLLDLENPLEFNYTVLDSVELVVFTAAISGPDQCAYEYERCWKINVEGTVRFIIEAVSRGCKVLYFSSDAVYGDISGEIYTEKSRLKGDTVYGKMKRAVEEEFAEEPLFKSVRLSYVMSANDRFVSYCLNCIREGSTAEIFHPFYRNVVSVSDVVNVVSWLARHYEEFAPKALNVAGDELVSRVRMADELNRIFDNRLKYAILRPGEDFFRNRPMVTQMKSLYLREYGIINSESFTDKIQREMERIKL